MMGAKGDQVNYSSLVKIKRIFISKYSYVLFLMIKLILLNYETMKEFVSEGNPGYQHEYIIFSCLQ